MAELTEEQIQEEQEKVEEKLQIFGTTLGKQRDEWVRSRYSCGVDKRWLEDEDQYNSKDPASKMASNMMTSVEEGYPITTKDAKPHRSTVFIEMTRQKTNAAEARVSDILLPTDDRNWGIEPTPDPKLMDMATSDSMAMDEMGQQMIDPKTQQPVKHSDVAKKVMEEAKKKSKAMQTVITDQLVECDYLAELRKVIHDSAVLGSGIIKGPIVTNKMRKAWQPYTDGYGETVHQFVYIEELNPSSFRVDPRNIWPDPAWRKHSRWERIFERSIMTPKQVRELKKQPGYLKDQLRKVLEEGPKRSATMEEVQDEEDRDYATQVYEMWNTGARSIMTI